jgi:hypothetical protein
MTFFRPRTDSGIYSFIPKELPFPDMHNVYPDTSLFPWCILPDSLSYRVIGAYKVYAVKRGAFLREWIQKFCCSKAETLLSLAPSTSRQ